jgi:hypothetical protein
MQEEDTMKAVVQTAWAAVLFLVLSLEPTAAVVDQRVEAKLERPVSADLPAGAAPELKNGVDDTPGDIARDPLRDPRRKLRGLLIHHGPQERYSFMFPAHWQRYDVDDGQGIICSPGQDPRTGFHVYVRDLSEELGDKTTLENLLASREQAIQEMRTLPGCEILRQGWITKGTANGFEILATYAQDGETQVQLTRVLYHGPHEYTLYAQGASRYEYDVFADTFGFMYSTFVFGNLLDTPGLFPGA